MLLGDAKNFKKKKPLGSSPVRHRKPRRRRSPDSSRGAESAVVQTCWNNSGWTTSATLSRGSAMSVGRTTLELRHGIRGACLEAIVRIRAGGLIFEKRGLAPVT